MISLDEQPGAARAPEGRWVERRAKLFEAGEYPDKGVIVTEADLAALAAGFGSPVPMLIEHAQSPLELGYLKAVQQLGGELFGTVVLSAEANSLVERSGAHALSVGLAADLRQIREVSLVRYPRVADARLFNGESLTFVGTLDTSRPGIGREEATRTANEFVRKGKLCPAQVEFAVALLASGDVIEFSGSKRPLRELLIAMIERQPPMALFAEMAPAGPARHGPAMAPEEADFYRRHFPDISLDDIAAKRR